MKIKKVKIEQVIQKETEKTLLEFFGPLGPQFLPGAAVAAGAKAASDWYWKKKPPPKSKPAYPGISERNLKNAAGEVGTRFGQTILSQFKQAHKDMVNWTKEEILDWIGAQFVKEDIVIPIGHGRGVLKFNIGVSPGGVLQTVGGFAPEPVGTIAGEGPVALRAVATPIAWALGHTVFWPGNVDKVTGEEVDWAFDYLADLGVTTVLIILAFKSAILTISKVAWPLAKWGATKTKNLLGWFLSRWRVWVGGAAATRALNEIRKMYGEWELRQEYPEHYNTYDENGAEPREVGGEPSQPWGASPTMNEGEDPAAKAAVSKVVAKNARLLDGVSTVTRGIGGDTVASFKEKFKSLLPGNMKMEDIVNEVPILNKTLIDPISPGGMGADNAVVYNLDGGKQVIKFTAAKGDADAQWLETVQKRQSPVDVKIYDHGDITSVPGLKYVVMEKVTPITSIFSDPNLANDIKEISEHLLRYMSPARADFFRSVGVDEMASKIDDFQSSGNQRQLSFLIQHAPKIDAVPKDLQPKLIADLKQFIEENADLTGDIHSGNIGLAKGVNGSTFKIFNISRK
jgi:hypothetical protein|tara:strand:+ start:3891 stop:5600 length:1710 start_codon:yes stop_codon:yes gene_type:complete